MICRLCGNDDLYLYYTQGNKKEFSFYKCKECGLVNIDLDKIDLEKNQEKYEENFIDPKDDSKNRSAKDTYSFIKKHIDIRGDYLDIGCGNGALLYAAEQDGWRVNGLELSEYLSKKVNELLAYEVKAINFLNFEDFDKKYDLLTLRHVLEHLPDSILAMSKLNKLLKDNSYAVLEFPNIEAFSFKLKRMLENSGLKKKKYRENYVPGHCNEFCKESFEYLCKKTGFEVIKWENYSFKPISNFIYSMIPIGTKARVLIKKTENV